MAKRRRRKEPATKRRSEKDACFIIMPFGGLSDKYHKTIFEPAIVAAGLIPHRADDQFSLNGVRDRVVAEEGTILRIPQ